MPESEGSPLRAKYISTSSTDVLTRHVSAPLPPKDGPTPVKDKIAYLAALRISTKQLQEDINVFLTEKMGEDKDKACTAASGQSGAGSTERGAEQSNKEEEEEEEEEEIGDDDV